MGAKHDESHKRKEKPRSASTGLGSSSAMEALIKRRVPPPSQQVQQIQQNDLPQHPKKH